MVRVKYRYILAEIQTDRYNGKLKLPLNESQLKLAILCSVEVLHGDYGLACIQAGFSIKMYNPATRVFVLRVRRKFHSVVGSSLPVITSIGKLKVAVRTLHLSGTIRCAMKFLIKYDKEKLIQMACQHKDSPGVKEELSKMIEKCHKRLTKNRFAD